MSERPQMITVELVEKLKKLIQGRTQIKLMLFEHKIKIFCSNLKIVKCVTNGRFLYFYFLTIFVHKIMTSNLPKCDFITL